jgi:hypothetical protein
MIIYEQYPIRCPSAYCGLGELLPNELIFYTDHRIRYERIVVIMSCTRCGQFQHWPCLITDGNIIVPPKRAQF